MLDSGDTAWILVSTALVVLMTPGVGLFYAGMVRGKNVVSMISLAFVALVLVSVQWVLVGYSLAFSSDIAGFVGNLGYVGLNGVSMGCGDSTIPELAFMAFQLAFAVITLAILTSAMAERVKISVGSLSSGCCGPRSFMTRLLTGSGAAAGLRSSVH